MVHDSKANGMSTVCGLLQSLTEFIWRTTCALMPGGAAQSISFVDSQDYAEQASL